MRGLKGGVVRLLQRFGRSQRGNVAMMAGIALPMLLMISAGAIDLHHAAKVRSELQDALDAATLAAARSNHTAAADVQRVGMASLQANMPNYFKGNPGDEASFLLASKYEVQATATVQVKTIIANVFLPPYGKLFDDYLPMSASSQVLRASRNVEVAIALDLTGSMQNYMRDLRAAAKELVGIVVQGDQEIFTTRVALVPYAAGVNAGQYADAMRGAYLSNLPVSDAAWMDGAPINITEASSSSGFTTAQPHGLRVGDTVYLTGFATGRSSLNERPLQVSYVHSSTRFTVNTDLGSGRTDSYGQRRMTKCLTSQCHMVITSPRHGFKTDDYATVRNIMGISQQTYAVTRVSDDRFSVPVVAPSTAFRPGTGSVECHYDGCRVRKFINASRALQTLTGGTCVSERPYAAGRSTPTDAKPDNDNRSHLVGRGYTHTGSQNRNTCPAAALTPLTNELDDLNETIDDYQAAGSTAGQVGIEQAWYAISPTFGEIFPRDSRPNPFDTSMTVKAVVLMTDGEFNTPFCQGVIARNAGEASGSDAYKINCDATNGNGFVQSVKVCDAMKAQGIVVYTVGFNLQRAQVNSVTDTAYEVMYRCATNPEDNFFPTTSGTDLKEAFKQIGRDITRLRIAR